MMRMKATNRGDPDPCLLKGEEILSYQQQPTFCMLHDTKCKKRLHTCFELRIWQMYSRRLMMIMIDLYQNQQKT